MKLTKQQLKQIIKEELEKVLNEEAYTLQSGTQSIIDIEVKYHEGHNQVYANIKTESGEKFQAMLSNDGADPLRRDGTEVMIFWGDQDVTELFTPEDEEKVKSAIGAWEPTTDDHHAAIQRHAFNAAALAAAEAEEWDDEE